MAMVLCASVYLFSDLAFCAALSSERKLLAPNNYIRIVRFPSNSCIRFVCFRSLLVAMPNCCKMSISIRRFIRSTRPHPFSAFLLINFPFYFSIIRCRLSTEKFDGYFYGHNFCMSFSNASFSCLDRVSSASISWSAIVCVLNLTESIARYSGPSTHTRTQARA